MKAKRQMISIAVADGKGGIEPMPIMASVYDDTYAVHPTANSNCKTWAVTHIPTGFSLIGIWHPKKMQAHSLARHYADHAPNLGSFQFSFGVAPDPAFTSGMTTIKLNWIDRGAK